MRKKGGGGKRKGENEGQRQCDGQPDGDDLARVVAAGASKVCRETKVGNLENPLAGNEEVVGFEVAVQDPVVVQILQPSEHHKQVRLLVGRRQLERLVLDHHFEVCGAQLKH